MVYSIMDSCDEVGIKLQIWNIYFYKPLKDKYNLLFIKSVMKLNTYLVITTCLSFMLSTMGTCASVFSPVASTIVSGARANYCLESNWGHTIINTPLDMWDCWNGANQEWTYDSQQRIVQSAFSKLCVTATGSGNGASVVLSTCVSNNPLQNWNYHASDKSLRPKGAPSQCLDIANQNTTNGAFLDLWTCWGGPNQEWTAMTNEHPVPSPNPTPHPVPTPVPPPPVPHPTPASNVNPNVRYPDGTCLYYPKDNWWHADVSQLPVHPDSDIIMQGIGSGQLSLMNDLDWGCIGGCGHPITRVDTSKGQKFVDVRFEYDTGSVSWQSWPIPEDAKIENVQHTCSYESCFANINVGSDRHVFVMDDAKCLVYEAWKSISPNWTRNGTWVAACGYVFNLSSNAWPPIPLFETSAAASGLPMSSGILRYEEIDQRGVVDHAFGGWGNHNRAAFAFPASRLMNGDSDTAPWWGARYRLKSSFNCRQLTPKAQLVCMALQKYGMIYSDIGVPGSVGHDVNDNWYKYADDLQNINKISLSNMEVVDPGCPICYDWNCKAEQLQQCTHLPSPFQRAKLIEPIIDEYHRHEEL